jgi:mannose-6-phosphate isomerase-like protein (cupin superfamily)
MEARNVEAILCTAPHWQQGDASFWMLDAFNGSHTWIGRYSGESPWELHPDGEELFYILAGAVEFTLLTASSTEKVKVRSGEMFVVPRHTWHRQTCDGVVTALGATSGRTEHSLADDPRAA